MQLLLLCLYLEKADMCITFFARLAVWCLAHAQRKFECRERNGSSGVIRNGLLWKAGKKVELFWTIISLTSSKWSSLNAPWLLKRSIFFWVIPFSQFSAPAAFFPPLSGVIRNGSSQYKGQEGGNFGNQNSLTGCNRSSLNAPGSETPVSHSLLGDYLFPFSAFLSLG